MRKTAMLDTTNELIEYGFFVDEGAPADIIIMHGFDPFLGYGYTLDIFGEPRGRKVALFALRVIPRFGDLSDNECIRDISGDERIPIADKFTEDRKNNPIYRRIENNSKFGRTLRRNIKRKYK